MADPCSSGWRARRAITHAVRASIPSPKSGARRRSDARAAVAAGFDVHYSGFPNTAPHDGARLAAYEDILTVVYPSGDGARWAPTSSEFGRPTSTTSARSDRSEALTEAIGRPARRRSAHEPTGVRPDHAKGFFVTFRVTSRLSTSPPPMAVMSASVGQTV